MPRSLLVLAALLLLAVPAAATGGKQVRYVGIHPLPRPEGGGICYIEGPHVHIYDADRIQYRDHRGANYFVGDPVAYGYDGERFAYKGHHPIHVSAVIGDDDPDDVYCYLTGPHYHYFAPPDGPEFKVVGGAYFYVAEPPHAYVEARPAMMKINAVYQPLAYERPVVTVDAPIGWIGARAEFAAPVVVAPAPPVIVAPSAGIRVDARIPMPSLHVDVGIGAPAVIVHERPAVIIRERPVIIEHRVKIKHDNGWHRGHR
ncbi:MAG TPA: hypothetical protein VK601_00675 [Kofleriaceae bacterium]|nr:hypothetical protein [Kofleriaceae bacterium]